MDRSDNRVPKGPLEHVEERQVVEMAPVVVRWEPAAPLRMYPVSALESCGDLYQFPVVHKLVVVVDSAFVFLSLRGL